MGRNRNWKRKLMSMFLVCTLSMSMLPTSAMADTTSENSNEAKINDTYYDTLKAAMKAATDGQTVTLQKDVELTENIYLCSDENSTKTVTLDLNGHNITSGNGWKGVINIGDDGKDNNRTTILKIVGKGNLKKSNDTYAMINVSANENNTGGAGTLDLSGWTGGEITKVLVDGNANGDGTFIGPVSEGTKIGTLRFSNIQQGLNVGLKGGYYGMIQCASGANNNYNIASLLADGYTLEGADGSFESCKTKILNNSNDLKNVSVVKCNVYDVDESNKCTYCGTDLSSVSPAAIVTTEDNKTYSFLAETGENETTTIDSAVKYAYDHDGSIQLQADDLTIERANCPIDLNNHKVASLTSGGAGLLISGSGTVKSLNACAVEKVLKGGTYEKIETGAGTKLGKLLAEGYGFRKNDKSDKSWLTEEHLDKAGKGLLDDIDGLVIVTPLPMTNLTVTTPAGITYGEDLTVTAAVVTQSGISGAVTYEWYLDGTKVNSATEPTLTLTKNDYKDAKAHTIKCVATLDGYSLGKEITVTVAPANLSAAELTITNENDLVCTPDGNGLKDLTVSYTVSYGGIELKKGTDFTVSGSELVSGAGTYTLTMTGTGNYTGEKSLDYTVKQCKLHDLKTDISTSGLEKTYDGTTDITEKVPVSLKFETSAGGEVTLTKGTDYTVTAADFGDATVGDERNVNVTIELKNKNYIFENNKTEKKFENKLKGYIKQAQAPSATAGALEVTNDLEKTYTYDLKALLPKLTAPATYGKITYKKLTVTLEKGYYTSGAGIDADGVLSLPIQRLKTTTEGAIGTVTVTVKTTNYENITLTLNVSAKKRDVPVPSSSSGGSSSGSSSSGEDKKSDAATEEKTSTVELPVSSGNGNVAVSATVEGTTATIAVDSEQIDQIIDSGKKTVKLDLSSLSNVDTVKLPADMMSQVTSVKNIKVTIKLESGAIKLDRKALKKIDTSKAVTVSIQQTTLTSEMRQAVREKGDVVAVLDVDLYVGKKKKTYFRDSKLSISIPYTPEKGEDTSKLTVCFIRKNGKVKQITGTYNKRTKSFVFKTKRLTQYLLVNTDR